MSGWIVLAVLGLLPYVSTYLFNPFGGLVFQITTKPPIQTCGDTFCYNGGYCDKMSFPPKCTCNPSYRGYMCHLKKPTFVFPCPVPCFAGECVLNTLTHLHECACHPGFIGLQCETMEALTSKVATSKQFVTLSTTMTTVVKSTALPTTTTAATTTTHPIKTMSTIMATTLAHIRFHTCNMISTVMDLGNRISVNNTHVKSCTSGSFATPEAFVLDHCSIDQPSNWTQGVNVMRQCDSIPLYTPVATFFNGVYSPSGGLSGIFLGCLPNGFKLGVQECDKLPTILHLENDGIFTRDPQQYYSVQ